MTWCWNQYLSSKTSYYKLSKRICKSNWIKKYSLFLIIAQTRFNYHNLLISLICKSIKAWQLMQVYLMINKGRCKNKNLSKLKFLKQNKLKIKHLVSKKITTFLKNGHNEYYSLIFQIIIKLHLFSLKIYSYRKIVKYFSI